MQPLMQTDSEQLLRAGVAVGERTFAQLLASGTDRQRIGQTVCHQVGIAHRRLMLQSLGLPEQSDFTTFSWLGNTGSVALPTALALGLRSVFIQPQHEVALLGIGSGINSVMMSTTWPNPIVAGELDARAVAQLQPIATAE